MPQVDADADADADPSAPPNAPSADIELQNVATLNANPMYSSGAAIVREADGDAATKQ